MQGEAEALERALAGLRARRSPSKQVEARMLEALQLELGGPEGGEGGDGGAAGSGGGGAVSPAWVAKSVGATLGLTAAGLLVLWGVGSALRPLAPERAQTRAQPQVVAKAPPEGAPPEPPSALAPKAVLEPTPSLEPEPRRAPARATKAPSPSAPEAEASDPLERELALIQAARESSSPEAALASLEQHVEQFPSGLLADEREALRAIALCELQRLDEARAVALALVARRPGSPLRQRIQRRCPGLRAALEGG